MTSKAENITSYAGCNITFMPAHEKRVLIMKANSEGSGEPALPESRRFAHTKGRRENFRQRTTYEPRHDKTNNVVVHPASAQSDQSLRCALSVSPENQNVVTGILLLLRNSRSKFGTYLFLLFYVGSI